MVRAKARAKAKASRRAQFGDDAASDHGDPLAKAMAQAQAQQAPEDDDAAAVDSDTDTASGTASDVESEDLDKPAQPAPCQLTRLFVLLNHTATAKVGHPPLSPWRLKGTGAAGPRADACGRQRQGPSRLLCCLRTPGPNARPPGGAVACGGVCAGRVVYTTHRELAGWGG